MFAFNICAAEELRRRLVCAARLYEPPINPGIVAFGALLLRGWQIRTIVFDNDDFFLFAFCFDYPGFLIYLFAAVPAFQHIACRHQYSAARAEFYFHKYE